MPLSMVVVWCGASHVKLCVHFRRRLGGVSFTRPHEPMSLMKMGLCMVLVGHVNFLLAALVHGTVLRHITLDTQTLEYAISNILALTAGLVGILVGILTIVFSKNEKNRVLGTTLILWVPLIVMSVVEFVVSGRCCAVSVSFIRRRTRIHCETRPVCNTMVETLRAAVPPVIPCHVPPPPRCCHRDCELVRPPEQHELLRASRPYSSSRSAQNRAPSSPFNRASLNRASFWI
ncbi:transmembrane protein 54b isoform X5 [Ictalurus punctatus]|uniref:Transmembrane protein 54b isoform X5 n=1 Tax=Ictalurus punctatus TaxID=7998 RepID=A0A9F7R9R9_ICTPU|nr:transmembrane protein 54b isoform X5 [Ictalurus punctatus]